MLNISVWKDKNKQKRGWGWPIFKNHPDHPNDLIDNNNNNALRKQSQRGRDRAAAAERGQPEHADGVGRHGGALCRQARHLRRPAVPLRGGHHSLKAKK